ncbi:MAG: FAD binding domain-containing protein [Alsobacter sp.]
MPVTVRTCSSAAEAAGILANERGARFLAGGTLVMRALNEGDVALHTVVRATDPALARIDASGSRVTLGAGVTLSRILAERELSFLHPVARSIGGPAIRNMGTVGGNLFAPSPYGDLTVALLALDATVAVQSGFGARETALEEFLSGRDRMASVLVLSVSFARPQSPDAFRWKKVSRVKPKGASVLSIAASLPQGGGRVQGARIALGAMGPAPVRAKGAERALEGRGLDPSSIAAAVGAALEGTHPADDAIASAWYRREVAGVHLRRLLAGEA